ncbi:hypothetical protein Glove_212g12 [Diversispora epigaea]|uniref:Uncharacterized protein n=1 Tax=Diversispora epigaea TaxID=1348612 RepID=A0A397IN41_9GLOM|nr:hypothetical protein Glove_212g12 [Diversispora epigaea]
MFQRRSSSSVRFNVWSSWIRWMDRIRRNNNLKSKPKSSLIKRNYSKSKSRNTKDDNYNNVLKFECIKLNKSRLNENKMGIVALSFQSGVISPEVFGAISLGIKATNKTIEFSFSTFKNN